MKPLASFLISAVRNNTRKIGTFTHGVLFGHKNLLITNALISALMGALGDSIQQNYEILKDMKRKPDTESQISFFGNSAPVSGFNVTRNLHMTAAGLTTGITTHYWYIILDRFLGVRKTPLILAKKVLIDQIIFSPINLFVYFSTLGICERSSWHHVKAELIEKGMENIYVAEWIIWPPAQLINFALLPLRYRILFDNVISLGFDIYSPYVKYNTSLSEELPKQLTKNNVA